VRGHLPIGAVLAGYRVIELIGEGAGGAVYRAERAGAGGQVALEVLADHLARDDRVRRRFLRESEIAAGLRHRHVVEIPDVGEAAARSIRSPAAPASSPRSGRGRW
jgi:serine/threonine-protein kinase